MHERRKIWALAMSHRFHVQADGLLRPPCSSLRCGLDVFFFHV